MADLTSVSIEQIKTGDLVLAFDSSTGKSAPARVLETFVHSYAAGSTLIRINDDLVATPEHPFFRNGSWAPANQLAPGDEVLRVKAGGAGKEPEVVSEQVTSVRLEQNFKAANVYNLEVDEFHDYFAGALLVHNKPIPVMPIQ